MSDEHDIEVYLKQSKRPDIGLYTVIKGISSDEYDLKKLAKVMKGMIGTHKKYVNIKRSLICFHGDHVERVKQLLDTFGFT